MKKIPEKTLYKDLMRPGSFVGATLVASSIKNALIIFHGIAGCNIEAVHFRSDNIPGGHYVPIIPTGLNEHDCIGGGYEKLLKALRYWTQKRSPELVFILTSDATSITGDDIQSAAKIVEQETGIRIIALDTPGFAGGVAKGADLLLNQIPLPNDEINLVAPFLMGSKNWKNDADEITRLLKASDVKGNFNLSGEKLQNIEEKLDFYGKNLPLPLGCANTEEWLLATAKDLGNGTKAQEIISSDMRFLREQLRFNYNFSWMSTLMCQKRCGLLAQAKFGASLARCLLWDYRIIPRVVGLIAETDRAMEQALELLEAVREQADIRILINPTYFDYGNALKDAQVDFSIGSIHDKPLSYEHKIPHLSLCGYYFFNQYNFIPWPLMGIRGSLGLLSELSRIMEETFYIRIVTIKN